MISVVVPALNERENIAELYRRVTQAAEQWGDDHELLVVDDGSTDDTLAILEQIAATDARLKVVSLTRNFGHQAAVTAGLHHARGSIVCVLDADLQDPPEEILPFIDRVRDGTDVVYAIRRKRKEGVLKRASYFLYYRILRRIATLDIPLDSGDFCVMNAEVVRAINSLPERNRFVRGLRTWVGYRQEGLPYERSARYAGAAKYTFLRMLRLGMDGIVSFSYRPLQLIMLLGMTVGAFAFILGILVLVQYLGDYTIAGYNPRQARGWTSLVLTLLFSSAVQLFCLGILGEYIGRLFDEAKRRPVYLVRRRIGTAPPEDLAT
ncbi:MAG TPA: glycosyltransferase family 2 protein [Gemmatimonadaceae bacterium]